MSIHGYAAVAYVGRCPVLPKAPPLFMLCHYPAFVWEKASLASVLTEGAFCLYFSGHEEAVLITASTRVSQGASP